jgi:phosphonate transport system substrate-binding protein
MIIKMICDLFSPTADLISGTQSTAGAFVRLRGYGCFWVTMAVLCCVSSNANSHSPPLFRIGFSKTTFGEVNENDAIAAVRVWAQAVARERDILADPQPTIFWNVNEIILALTNKSIDCICLTTDEYAMIPSQMTGDTIVAGVVSGSITEEFVLLVHRKSGIDRLKDL